MSQDRYTRAFDKASSDFDRLGDHLWRPIGQAVVGATDPRPGERVLDACCGNGASAIPAARRVGERGHVDAVDMAPAMVSELTRLAADLPQLHPHTADVTCWQTGNYDVVQSVLGVFFFPDMNSGSEHLVRCAHPGGRVGLTVWRRGAIEVLGEHLARSVAQVTGVASEKPRPSSIADIREAEPFRDWMTERGLVDVIVHTHELRIALTPEIAWLMITGSGYIAALADLDETRVADVRRTYLASLDAQGVSAVDATTLTAIGTRPG